MRLLPSRFESKSHFPDETPYSGASHKHPFQVGTNSSTPRRERARGGGIIELMRKATLDAMERRRLTAYRICKTLDLNLGNVYAYLGKGDISKVSRNTARRIMEYATG